MSQPLTKTKMPPPTTLRPDDRKAVATSRGKHQAQRLSEVRPYLLVGGGAVVSRREMSGQEAKDLNAQLLVEFQVSMIDGKGTIPLWRWNEERLDVAKPVLKTMEEPV